MPRHQFPADARLLLSSLRGHKLVAIRRQVLVSDYTVLSPDIRDEESDGPTEFVFDYGTIHFVPNTEQMSVKVGGGPMPAWGKYYAPLDPTGNDFWRRRVGKPVTAVDVLISDYATPENRSEFAVEFEVQSGLRFVLEYVSDESITDALRVSDSSPVGSYRRVHLA